MKALIEYSYLDGLDLRIGSVLGVQPLLTTDLLGLVVQTISEIRGLAPRSLGETLAPGSRVIVTVSLHPLTIDGMIFTGAVIAEIAADLAVEDGARVS